MHGTGLTHGRFYKHFPSKNDLLAESIGESFQQTASWLVEVGEKATAGSAWKAIVTAYLSFEHCDHPETGCPLAALGTELARSEKDVKTRISAAMVNYKDQLVRFMPRAFFAIFGQ